MTAIPSQITSASIVCQTVVQAQIKENITAPRHQPFVGDRWIFLPKASETEMFPFDDVIMAYNLYGLETNFL